MKLAIMQPYVFPYIGYFQLIQSVDKFVFYNDVNFIKGGWINRNRILTSGQPKYFTIPLEDMSSFKPINQTMVNLRLYEKWRVKFLRTLNQTYGKAPHFKEIYPLIEKVLIESPNSISDLSISSVTHVCNYLGLNTELELSDKDYAKTLGLERKDRIVEICRMNKCETYVNASGGQELYDKNDFLAAGIGLYFIHNEVPVYQQFNLSEFVPGLSIIDVLMFNSIEEVKTMMSQYTLS